MREKWLSSIGNDKKKLYLTAVLTYIVLLAIMPKFGHAWDTACWGLWSARMTTNGLISAYTEGSTVNYLPLYLYVLKAYGSLVGTDKIFPLVHWLKAVTLIFDIGSVLIICTYLPDKFKRWKYFIAITLNIGFIYNTLIWNQVDGILTFFILASLTAGLRKRIDLSILAFILAMNFKLQGIIFLPVLGLLWLWELDWKSILKGFGYAIIAEFIILLPFISAGVAANIGDVIFGSVDYYQSISMNAFNFWYLIMDGDLMFVKDNTEFVLGMTQKQFGLMLFLLTSSLVCVPLLIRWIRTLKTKESIQVEPGMFVGAMALLVMFFFYFNTQMHERYIHPVMVFSSILAFRNKQWAQWIIVSVAYALSLESICRFLELNNYGTLIFHPKFLASLFGISMLTTAFWWLRKFVWSAAKPS